jgi:ArsR family transcriptional regulator
MSGFTGGNDVIFIYMEDTRVYELQAEVYKVLSNPVRLMIIDCLREGEKTVTEIVECLGLSKSNVSQHLNYMKAVGILCSTKEGRKVKYYISDRRLLNSIDGIRKVLFERFVRCGQIISSSQLEELLSSLSKTP